MRREVREVGKAEGFWTFHALMESTRMDIEPLDSALENLIKLGLIESVMGRGEAGDGFVLTSLGRQACTDQAVFEQVLR